MVQSRRDAGVEKLHAAMRRVPHWILSVVCLAVILWLTLAPHPLGEEEIPLFPGADKIAHGLMFFALTLCLCFDALRRRGWRAPGLPLVSALTLAAMLTGIGIELVQPCFGRGFEFWDMCADAFGAVVAGSLWVLIGGALGLTDGERRRMSEKNEPDPAFKNSSDNQ